MPTELERLRQEVADLREALGLADINQAALTLAAKFYLRPLTARVAQMLYAARGDWVPVNALVDLLDPHNVIKDPGNYVNVHTAYARRALGADAIEVRGGAYRLTEAGMARITKALDRNSEAV